MAQNLITIELCAEDRARLDRLADALEKAAGRMPLVGIDLAKVMTPAAEAPQEAEKAPEVKQPKETQPEPGKAPAPAVEAETPAPAKEAPQVTAQDVRQVAVELIRAGKQNEAGAIIHEYAESIGEIPADKLAEVLQKLQAVGV